MAQRNKEKLWHHNTAIRHGKWNRMVLHQRSLIHPESSKTHNRILSTKHRRFSLTLNQNSCTGRYNDIPSSSFSPILQWNSTAKRNGATQRSNLFIQPNTGHTALQLRPDDNNIINNTYGNLHPNDKGNRHRSIRSNNS